MDFLLVSMSGVNSYSDTEKVKLRLMRRLDKMLVLLLCGTLFLSACGNRADIETPPQTDTQSVEETESPSESESVSESESESEPLTEEETESVSETESESVTEPSTESEAAVSIDYTVIPSIYEDISMSWADVCMLVLDCVLTTPVSYAGDPVFAAMYCNGAEEPLLITGHQTGDQAGNYYIYSFVNNQRIYQLGNYVGIFYWNQEADRLCLQVSDAEFQVYEYRSNHMILLETVAALPEGYSILSMNPLNVSPPITTDNLRNYILTM